MTTVQPATSDGWSRSRCIALGAAAVVALTSLQLARQGGTPSWQSIWAEDGAIYGREAFALPIARTLLRGYGGYVQLVPRLLASLTDVVGISGLAIAFAVSASFVTALLAVFVFRHTAGWIDDVWLRAVVAAMTALVPTAYLETNANIANLGWPLLVASAWAIASRRTRPVDTVLRALVVAATAMSTTVIALFAPAALGVAIWRRQRRDWIVFAAFSVALAVQLALDRTAAASPPARVSSSVGDLFQVFGVRVVSELVIGERWLPDAWSAWRYWMVALAGALLIALVVGCRRAGRDRWCLVVAALVMAFAVFAIPVWIRGSEPLRLHASGLSPSGSRYLVAPIALLVGGLAVVVDGAGRSWLRRLVAVHAIVLIAVSFQLDNPRSVLPPWDRAVRDARAECATKPASSIQKLPIAPARWMMPVACSHVG